MRGFFGRQRGEKPPASVAVIDSYETSLYPPRPYRCHTIEGGGVGGSPDHNAAVIVLPSIDADSVCQPFTKDTQTVNKNQRKPVLKEYFSCFVSPSCCNGEILVPPVAEPLNIFHYVTPTLSTSNSENDGGDLACLIGLPVELRRFNVGYRSKIMEKPKDILIPRFRRKRPPKPTRRGGKVTVSEPSAAVVALSARTVKRPREDEDLGSQASLNSAEDDDDDVSVQYEADDDDDGVSDGFDAGGDDLVMD